MEIARMPSSERLKPSLKKTSFTFPFVQRHHTVLFKVNICVTYMWLICIYSSLKTTYQKEKKNSGQCIPSLHLYQSVTDKRWKSSWLASWLDPTLWLRSGKQRPWSMETEQQKATESAHCWFHMSLFCLAAHH